MTNAPTTSVRIWCTGSGQNCYPGNTVLTDLDGDGDDDGYFALNNLPDGTMLWAPNGDTYLVRAKNILVT